jgi:hypothetical protein
MIARTVEEIPDRVIAALLVEVDPRRDAKKAASGIRRATALLSEAGYDLVLLEKDFVLRVTGPERAKRWRKQKGKS